MVQQSTQSFQFEAALQAERATGAFVHAAHRRSVCRRRPGPGDADRGLPIGLLGVALALLINGMAMSCFTLVWINTLQEQVPRELMGRVVSVDMLGSFVLLPVGYAVAGWATDLLGAQLVFVIGGTLTIALIGLGLLHPAIRGLD